MRLINLLLPVLMGLTGAIAGAADYTFIGNEKLSRDSISVKEVRDIYLGERSSLGGDSVSPCILSSNDGKGFYSSMLDVSEEKFSQIWIRKELTGAASAPVTRDSIDSVIKFVGSTKGAIGFVPKSAASRLDGKGVKILDLN